MAVSPARVRSALTVVGGLLWSVALAVDDVAPALAGVAAVVPVLVGFGVVELYARYGGRWGRAGRAGAALTGAGLAALVVAVLVWTTPSPSLVVVFVAAVPGVTGVVALAVGSALLAASLRRLGVIDRLTAVLLGLGVPATPLVGALLAVVPDSDAPGAVLTGLAGAPYGLAWVALGARLLRTDPDAAVGRGVPAGEVDGDLDPVPDVPVQSAVAGVVAGGLVLVSVGRFVPLGPLSGTPWVGQRLVVDAAHLLVGVVGVAVAGRRSALARTYNRVVGLAALGAVALAVLGTFLSVPGFAWLAGAALALTLPDIVLYLPVGVVLAVVGFGDAALG